MSTHKTRAFLARAEREAAAQIHTSFNPARRAKQRDSAIVEMSVFDAGGAKAPRGSVPAFEENPLHFASVVERGKVEILE